MSKDRRYKTVKVLIETGNISSVAEIFDSIPKSVVARDFGTNYVRFIKLLNNVASFRMQEIYTLAKLFNVDEKVMLDLFYNQYLQQKTRSRRSRET